MEFEISDEAQALIDRGESIAQSSEVKGVKRSLIQKLQRQFSMSDWKQASPNSFDVGTLLQVPERLSDLSENDEIVAIEPKDARKVGAESFFENESPIGKLVLMIQFNVCQAGEMRTMSAVVTSSPLAEVDYYRLWISYFVTRIREILQCPVNDENEAAIREDLAQKELALLQLYLREAEREGLMGSMPNKARRYLRHPRKTVLDIYRSLRLKAGI